MLCGWCSRLFSHYFDDVVHDAKGGTVPVHIEPLEPTLETYLFMSSLVSSQIVDCSGPLVTSGK